MRGEKQGEGKRNKVRGRGPSRGTEEKRKESESKEERIGRGEANAWRMAI